LRDLSGRRIQFEVKVEHRRSSQTYSNAFLAD
jgi:hypothetical protein